MLNPSYLSAVSLYAEHLRLREELARLAEKVELAESIARRINQQGGVAVAGERTARRND